MRRVVAILEVDDDAANNEDLGTIDYLEREFCWINQSGIFLINARTSETLLKFSLLTISPNN